MSRTNLSISLSLRFISFLLLLVALIPLIGCKPKQEKKAAPPATTNPDDPYQDPNGMTPIVAIEVVGQVGTTFQFGRNDLVQLRFRISGTTTQSNLVTALAEMPVGGLLTAANTAEPIFTWTPSSEGTYYLTLLVRDLDACSQSGATDCQISEQQYGYIVPNINYDVTQRYTIVVGSSSNIGGSGMVGNTITDGGSIHGSGIFGNSVNGVGNVLGGVGSFISNMGSSIWAYLVGLFT